MKLLLLSALASVILITAALVATKIKDSDKTTLPENKISIENGTQTISIAAKGGYYPTVSNARADMPTTVRIKTQGTFDCSSALSIPAIGYRKNLPPSGTTDIELGPQKAGTKLTGTCAMGMYAFDITFGL